MPIDTFPFHGGTNTQAAFGQSANIIFTGTWLPQDTWTLFFVTDNQGDFTLGKGNISATSPITGLGLDNRIFLGILSEFNFCAIDNPLGWEEQNVGAGFVPYTSNFGVQDTVNGFASYQGNLLVAGRRSVQIWQINADPALFNKIQTLVNIGTFAPLSIQSLGDLDVLLLSDTGIRSIRVRDASNNAYVEDLGIAIDRLVAVELSALSDAQKATCCGIIDPTANRYWCFIGTKLFVLSYFPTSKITGWSEYLMSFDSGFSVTITGGSSGNIKLTVPRIGGVPPTCIIANTPWNTNAATTAADMVTQINGTSFGYVASAVGAVVTVVAPNGVTGRDAYTNLLVEVTTNITYTTALVQTSFTPQKFMVYNGQVWVRSATAAYAYGGSDGNQYDYSVATLQLPYVAGSGKGETPATRRQAKGINMIMDGTWNVYASMDWIGETYKQLIISTQVSDSSIDKGYIPYSDNGTHFSMKAVSVGVGRKTISSLVFHYEIAEEQA